MKKKRAVDKTKIPDAIRQLLGPPPILSTEDEHLYYATIETLAKDINPDDIIIWFLIKDLADYRTEIARYRRFKVAWLKSIYTGKLRSAVGNVYSVSREQIASMIKERDEHLGRIRQQHSLDYEQREKYTKKTVRYYNKQIRKKEMRVDEVEAKLLLSQPNESDFAGALTAETTSEQIDQALATAEQNFLSTLRELGRHIFGFGKKLRERLQNLEAEVLGGKGSESSAPSIVPGPVAENVE